MLFRSANNGGTVTGNVIISQNVTAGNVIVSSGGQLVFPDGTRQNTAASGSGGGGGSSALATLAFLNS